MSVKNKKVGLTKAGDLLSAVLKNTALQRSLEQYAFVQKWDQIVGKEIAKNAKPDRITRGILYIRVKSSVWSQELNFQKELIIANLKKLSPDSVNIVDIKFFIDPNLR